MNLLINTCLTLASFLLMEGVAWFTHKFIMHGFLWFLHRDHHLKDHQGFFERNDFFFLLFATPGIILIFLGFQPWAMGPTFFLGLGITLYGFTYFLVHDIFIHQRFQWLRNIDNHYFKAIRRAHKMHHKHLGKEQGECFGMLWVPRRYFKEDKKLEVRG
jgi:beta-carotene 3-hydroxylase